MGRKSNYFIPEVVWVNLPLGPYDEVYVIPELRQSWEDVYAEIMWNDEVKHLDMRLRYGGQPLHTNDIHLDNGTGSGER